MVSGGKVSYINGNSIPESWVVVLNEIKEKLGSVIVPSKVDIEQSDMGPPTTIRLGLILNPVVMRSEVPLYDAVFIELTSPSELHRNVAATSFLSEKAKNELNEDYVLLITPEDLKNKDGLKGGAYDANKSPR